MKLKVFNKNGFIVFQGVANDGNQHEEITSRFPKCNGYEYEEDRDDDNVTSC